MKGWSPRRIDQLGKVITGKTPPSARPEEFGDEFPFITPTDITGDQKYVRTERFLSAKGMESHRRLQLPAKSVCVVCIGATIGKVCQVTTPSMANQQINAIIPTARETDADFAYYLAITLKDSLVSFAGGSATPILNKSAFSAVKILAPEFKTQRKIAAVLAAYDDLIEANRRRIALLERMAEEIYREWFVRLRFPGHEKTKIRKGIPAGWSPTTVRALTVSIRRGVAPVYEDAADGIVINQKCIRDGRVNLEYARRQSRDVSTDRFVQVGDILVNSTGEGTLGRVAQLLSPVLNCIVDTHVSIVRPAVNAPMHFLGMTLRAWEPHLATMGRGSTNQTELSPAVIGAIKIVAPSGALGKRFEELVGPLHEQSRLLGDQNTTLTRARDLLLPRLISGKLAVEHLAIAFPPGMAEA